MSRPPPPNCYAAPAEPPPQKSGGGWLTFVVILIVLILLLGTLALAYDEWRRRVYGVSEVRGAIGSIARAAQDTYQRDGKLCDSAGPVPATVPPGRKYQSTPSDWNDFACLKFSLRFPQRYQYTYSRTGDSFVITARGDLDADGIFSEFTQRGTVIGGRVVLDPAITVKDESE